MLPSILVVEGNPKVAHRFKAGLTPDHPALFAASASETLVGALDGRTRNRVSGRSIGWVVHHVFVAFEVTGQLVDGFALSVTLSPCPFG